MSHIEGVKFHSEAKRDLFKPDKIMNSFLSIFSLIYF